MRSENLRKGEKGRKKGEEEEGEMERGKKNGLVPQNWLAY